MFEGERIGVGMVKKADSCESCINIQSPILIAACESGTVAWVR